MTIRVGSAPDGKDFIAHKKSLSARSEYFRNILEDDEITLHPISLPEKDPIMFQMCLQYVYTGELIWSESGAEAFSILNLHELELSAIRAATRDEFIKLVLLYAFAQSLRDGWMKNCIIRHFYGLILWEY